MGGGLVGLLTAAELVVRGIDVTVLDANKFAQQASWAGGGILSPLAPWAEPLAVTRLVAHSAQLTREWVTRRASDYGPDCEFWVCGMQVVGADQAAKQWLECHDVSHSQAGDVLTLPEVAQLRTPRYGQRMLAWLKAHGATLVEHSEVQSIDRNTAQCNGTTYRADALCICAGPWSSSIAGVGMPVSAVEPVRGQMLLLSAGKDGPTSIVRDGPTYLIPRRDGRVLVGSTLERSGFDASTTESARRQLWRDAVSLWPGLQTRTIERQWAGLRPESATGMPLIGRLEERGPWVNTGHYRNGVTLAAGSAALVADAICGDALPDWASAFDPEHLAAGLQAC